MLHVSGGLPTHHQELINCTYIIWYMSSLLAATASGSSKTMKMKKCKKNPKNKPKVLEAKRIIH
jgi:hypothetical protein